MLEVVGFAIILILVSVLSGKLGRYHHNKDVAKKKLRTEAIDSALAKAQAEDHVNSFRTRTYT